MKVLLYFRDHTPCPYRDGVVIMTQECKACEHYRGECVTQRILCGYDEDKQ